MLFCTVDQDVWNCLNYTFPSSSVSDWSLTGDGHTNVYNVTANTGGTTVSSITPVLVDGLLPGPMPLVINNIGADPLIINDSSTGGGTAGRRIQLPPTYGTSVTLAQHDTIVLYYDNCASTQVWRVLSCTVDIEAASTIPTRNYSTTAFLSGIFQILSGDISGNAGNGIFCDTGFGLTLKGSGAMLLTADVDGHVIPTVPSNATLKIRLYDWTAGADVPLSHRQVMKITASGGAESPCSLSCTYGPGISGHKINLQASVSYTIAPASAEIVGYSGASNQGGNTVMNYVEIF